MTYDKFWLPEDVKFFIYSNDKKQNVGAFTSKNNKGNKDDVQGFATTLLYSDTIVLEYYSPKEVKDIGIICIDTIVHGYRSILQDANSNYKEKESFQGLPICAIDINCSEGDDWQNEKRAIALMMVGNRVMGTGSLVNNTNNDFTPYFLTAKHVTDGYVNFNQWIFF